MPELPAVPSRPGKSPPIEDKSSNNIPVVPRRPNSRPTSSREPSMEKEPEKVPETKKPDDISPVADRDSTIRPASSGELAALTEDQLLSEKSTTSHAVKIAESVQTDVSTEDSVVTESLFRSRETREEPKILATSSASVSKSEYLNTLSNEKNTVEYENDRTETEKSEKLKAISTNDASEPRNTEIKLSKSIAEENQDYMIENEGADKKELKDRDDKAVRASTSEDDKIDTDSTGTAQRRLAKETNEKGIDEETHISSIRDVTAQKTTNQELDFSGSSESSKLDKANSALSSSISSELMHMESKSTDLPIVPQRPKGSSVKASAEEITETSSSDGSGAEISNDVKNLPNESVETGNNRVDAVEERPITGTGMAREEQSTRTSAERATEISTKEISARELVINESSTEKTVTEDSLATEISIKDPSTEKTVAKDPSITEISIDKTSSAIEDSSAQGIVSKQSSSTEMGPNISSSTETITKQSTSETSVPVGPVKVAHSSVKSENFTSVSPDPSAVTKIPPVIPTRPRKAATFVPTNDAPPKPKNKPVINSKIGALRASLFNDLNSALSRGAPVVATSAPELSKIEDSATTSSRSRPRGPQGRRLPTKATSDWKIIVTEVWQLQGTTNKEELSHVPLIDTNKDTKQETSRVCGSHNDKHALPPLNTEMQPFELMSDLSLTTPKSRSISGVLNTGNNTPVLEATGTFTVLSDMSAAPTPTIEKGQWTEIAGER